VLSLLWLPRRARLLALTGVVAVLVFALFASVGLPINTRYAFLASAILCVFCGAGVFGWTLLSADDRRRRWWMAGGAVVVVALIAYTPAQYRSAHRELDNLAHQQSIEGDLVALVDSHAISLRCGPVGVPNHRPNPAACAAAGKQTQRDRQRPGPPDLNRHLPGPVQQRSGTGLHPRPPRPATR